MLAGAPEVQCNSARVLSLRLKLCVLRCSIPLYGMGADPSTMLVRELEHSSSLVSLTLMHATDEELLIRIVHAIMTHNLTLSPIMVRIFHDLSSEYSRDVMRCLQELRIVYEMDNLSPEFCKALCELLATDTLFSLQISKNKEWHSDLEYDTGINDGFVKQMMS